MQPPIDYLVSVTDVSEVALVGYADASFWRERLEKEDLFAYPGGGQVEITLAAASIRWRGVDSLEFTMSLAVMDRPEGGEKSYYLVQAFSSSRIFVWVERGIFSSPYSHANVRLDTRLPASFGVLQGKDWYFSAQMAAQARLVNAESEVWEGIIYLPGDRILGLHHHFYASLGGRTHTSPFVPGQDRFYINSSTPRKVFNWLQDSCFSPQTWKISLDAVHSRSVTVQTRRKIG